MMNVLEGALRRRAHGLIAVSAVVLTSIAMAACTAEPPAVLDAGARQELPPRVEPPAGPAERVDAFAHSADPTDVTAFWEHAPVGVEATETLILVAQSRSEEVHEVTPQVRVSGMGDRDLEVRLDPVVVPAYGEVAVPIELDRLPIHSASHSVQLLASIVWTRAAGEMTIQAEPLAFHFDEGFGTAYAYTLDTMVTELDGGAWLGDPRMVSGRVLEDGGFQTIAQGPAEDPAVEATSPVDVPAGFTRIAYTYEITEPGDELGEGPSSLAAAGTTAEAPGPNPPGPTPGGVPGPNISCLLWPWNCCTGDNCVDVCADWSTTYVDSSNWWDSPREDYAVGSGTQIVDASYAEYDITRWICNGQWCYQSTIDSGVLGPDGCAMVDVDPGSGYVLNVDTRMQYGGKTYPVEYHTANDANSNVGVVSVSKGFTYLPGTPLPPPLLTLPTHPAANAAAMISRALASGTVVDQNSGFTTLAGLGCTPQPGIPGTDACAGSSIKTGPYTNPDNSAGDLRWKFILAHEFGHVMQRKAMGGINNPYCFDTNGYVTYNCAPPNLADHPNAPASCSCDHVSGSNGLHCLQSYEHGSAAQIEGFAQFYASRVWNNPGSGCLFHYYKQFRNDNGTVTVPPVDTSCGNYVNWRDEHCFGSWGGTEYDWMQFFWNLEAGTGTTVSMYELFDMYRGACTNDWCSGESVSWEELASSAAAEFGGGSAKYNAVIAAGDAAGVDTTQF